VSDGAMSLLVVGGVWFACGVAVLIVAWVLR